MAIGDNGTTATPRISVGRRFAEVADPTKKPFFWLTGFFIVYCTRFEDFIPGMQ